MIQPAFDWGEPIPAEWSGAREAFHCRLPADLIRRLREQARRDGVTVSVLAARLLEAGLHADHEHDPLEEALRAHAGVG